MSGVPSADARFKALFNAHHRNIHAYCLRRLPTDDANEAASEVFLVAWRRFEKIPESEQLMWLYGVARNVVRNLQRSARRQIRLSAKANSVAPTPQDGPEIQVIRSEEHEEVAMAMETLKEPDRELLQLKVWEGLSNDQVATVLGITKRAVEGRYTRALSKLSKQLERGIQASGSPFSAERGGAQR